MGKPHDKQRAEKSKVVVARVWLWPGELSEKCAAGLGPGGGGVGGVGTGGCGCAGVWAWLWRLWWRSSPIQTGPCGLWAGGPGGVVVLGAGSSISITRSDGQSAAKNTLQKTKHHDHPSGG